MANNWKSTKTENPNFRCWKCKSNEIKYYCPENLDHEDYHYKCKCGNDWWVEGSDY